MYSKSIDDKYMLGDTHIVEVQGLFAIFQMMHYNYGCEYQNIRV